MLTWFRKPSLFRITSRRAQGISYISNWLVHPINLPLNDSRERNQSQNPPDLAACEVQPSESAYLVICLVAHCFSEL